MYSLLLVKLDWHKIAQEASVSDESSICSEDDQDYTKTYTYSKPAYLDEIHDDDYVNADLYRPWLLEILLQPLSLQLILIPMSY